MMDHLDPTSRDPSGGPAIPRDPRRPPPRTAGPLEWALLLSLVAAALAAASRVPVE